MPSILMQAAGMAPDDCALSGICALLKPESPVPPGVMYVAVGMIAIGAVGYIKARTANRELRTTIPDAATHGE